MGEEAEYCGSGGWGGPQEGGPTQNQDIYYVSVQISSVPDFQMCSMCICTVRQILGDANCVFVWQEYN